MATAATKDSSSLREETDMRALQTQDHRCQGGNPRLAMSPPAPAAAATVPTPSTDARALLSRGRSGS